MSDLDRGDEIVRLLVDHVQDYAILALDPEGNVATWKEGARRIKGYTTDDILGRHFSIFYTPEDGAPNRKVWVSDWPSAATWFVPWAVTSR